MKSTQKWFLIPPAIAALLILGTLSMQGPAPKSPAKQPAPAAEPRPTPPESTTEDLPRTARTAPTPPRTPDLWQMASALVGVLLLGAGGILVLRRLRNGPGAPRSGSLVTLRQSLRLGGRQAVHVLEFDEKLLLVGEHERGLVLIDSGKLPERTADEAEVLARGLPGLAVDAIAGDDEDDGAVPKNLVIPRPDAPPARRLPTPPATRPAPAAGVGLNDFRNLLQKVGRA
jgi:flagellar biogenesis protein FliO